MTGVAEGSIKAKELPKAIQEQLGVDGETTCQFLVTVVSEETLRRRRAVLNKIDESSRPADIDLTEIVADMRAKAEGRTDNDDQ